MQKTNIKNLMEKMEKEIDQVELLTEHGTGYIGDIVQEKADLLTEIYTSELFKNAYSLYLEGYTERAVTELGADGKDLANLLISENLQEIMIYYTLDLLIDSGIENLTTDQLDLINSINEYDIDHTNDLEDLKIEVIELELN